MSSERKEYAVELGELRGAMPVRWGSIYALLLVTDKALILTLPKPEILKSLVLGGFSRLLEARALVKLSQLKPDEIVEKLGSGREKRFKILGFIKRELIRYVEFYKKFFGLGVVAFKIYTSKGKALDLSLIYGKGLGVNEREAVEHALKLFNELGVMIKKEKIKY